MCAAKNNRLDVVNFLLDNLVIDLNAVDIDQQTGTYMRIFIFLDHNKPLLECSQERAHMAPRYLETRLLTARKYSVSA